MVRRKRYPDDRDSQDRPARADRRRIPSDHALSRTGRLRHGSLGGPAAWRAGAQIDEAKHTFQLYSGWFEGIRSTASTSSRSRTPTILSLCLPATPQRRMERFPSHASPFLSTILCWIVASTGSTNGRWSAEAPSSRSSSARGGPDEEAEVLMLRPNCRRTQHTSAPRA